MLGDIQSTQPNWDTFVSDFLSQFIEFILCYFYGLSLNTLWTSVLIKRSRLFTKVS